MFLLSGESSSAAGGGTTTSTWCLLTYSVNEQSIGTHTIITDGQTYIYTYRITKNFHDKKLSRNVMQQDFAKKFSKRRANMRD